jgi:hypothetical protein
MFEQFLPHKKLTEILLQHDSTRLHTSLLRWEAITKFGRTVLHHPPYCPNLAVSDSHIFIAVKVSAHSTKFETKDDVICTVRTWLCEQDKA